jgi:hypothetical protein
MWLLHIHHPQNIFSTIFLQAGLFSRILSAFLIEVCRGLQEDSQKITNALLNELLQTQCNSTANIPIHSSFQPSSSILWVNGVWFSSLLFSLISALGTNLAKGWVA